MRPIATDVTRSVFCLSAEPIEMPLGGMTRVGRRKHILDGVKVGQIHSPPQGVTRRLDLVFAGSAFLLCSTLPVCTNPIFYHNSCIHFVKGALCYTYFKVFIIFILFTACVANKHHNYEDAPMTSVSGHLADINSWIVCCPISI